jgi:hypothetical protein
LNLAAQENLVVRPVKVGPAAEQEELRVVPRVESQDLAAPAVPDLNLY